MRVKVVMTLKVDVPDDDEKWQESLEEFVGTADEFMAEERAKDDPVKIQYCKVKVFQWAGTSWEETAVSEASR